MQKSAMKLTKQFAAAVQILTGEHLDVPDDMDVYIIVTPVSDREYNLRFAAESEMVEEYANDPDMQILSFNF